MSVIGRAVPFIVGGASVDSDATAWAAAVTTAGGTYSAGDLAAMSAFITSAKANGYWTKLNCFGPLYGADFAAALIAYTNGTWASVTNTGFIAANYARATGLTSAGNTRALTTSLAPSTLTNNSTHLSFYNRSSTADGRTHIGAANGTDAMDMFAPFSDNKVYSDQFNATAGQGRVVSTSTIATPYGHIIGTRTASNAHTVYRNGSSIGTASTSGGTLANITNVASVFVANTGGGFSNTAACSCGAFSIGGGLSSTDAANYYTDLQTLMTAAGRNV